MGSICGFDAFNRRGTFFTFEVLAEVLALLFFCLIDLTALATLLKNLLRRILPVEDTAPVRQPLACCWRASLAAAKEASVSST